VRRRVALKLIKAGMDTREVVTRLESDRQALALMHHPAIAKVLDDGVTLDGRPYFVMEYVAGTPITTYCDRHTLTMRPRMELFVQACEGVQHAHQKVVIHRDLKPSNILVCEVDGKRMPRIIDFGLTKATSQRLTDGSIYTRVGAILGTLEYMSPEQADSGGEDIDTRTDVYSLDVVLYQLLAGALLLDLKKLAYEKMHQITLSEAVLQPQNRTIDVLALHEPLEHLVQLDPRQTRIVELHFFGGLNFEEIAMVLALSECTVKRDWSMARAWLQGELSKQP
jgi:eukaryotic-like serine/threonine-protein kinase